MLTLKLMSDEEYQKKRAEWLQLARRLGRKK
jgi:hypothetical protein